MKAYKIVEQRGLHLKTLFHGLDGSRTLPYGQWLTAVKRWSRTEPRKRRTFLAGTY